MSWSKRILFGNDPADEAVRQHLANEMRDRLAPFTFKIPTRRRNRLKYWPYWDPCWRASVYRAAKELNFETVNINDQVCTKTQAEADAIRTLAEAIHKKEIETRMADYALR